MFFKEFVIPKSKIISFASTIILITLFLTVVYLPTFIYPYVLTDEGWIIRLRNWQWAAPMMRPLFGVVALVQNIMMQAGSLASIAFVLRSTAIVGLALSAFFSMQWLVRWGMNRWHALSFACTVMTLPAFQIIVADGSQLSIAILSAILSVIFFDDGFNKKSVSRLLLSAVLLAFSLLIYQQQALIFFSLLAVPLLLNPGEKTHQVFALSGGIFATFISCLYFIIWKVMYPILWPGKIETRYGPDGVSVPSLDMIEKFFDERLFQIANLWSVKGLPPSFSWIIILGIAFVIFKFICDWQKSGVSVLLSYLILIGFVFASDSFIIIARAYNSYVTAGPISLLVFFWIFSGITLVLNNRSEKIIYLLPVMGGVFAYNTVMTEIAIPNWNEFNQIRSAILENPNVTNIHFNAPQSQPINQFFQEFSWRNSGTNVYLQLAAVAAKDDLYAKKKLTQQQYVNLGLTASSCERKPAELFGQDSHPHKPPLDSVIIDIN